MAMKTRYTVIEGEVMSELRSGTKRDYVPNPLGSTVALLDNTATKSDTFDFWPYGESSSRTGVTPTPFQYIGTSGYYSEPGSRCYVRARYLLSGIGSWLTVDPLWPYESDYGYVNRNPVTKSDPSGLFCQSNPEKRCKMPRTLDGLCIALLCSMKSAVDIYKAIPNPTESERKLIKQLIDLLKDRPTYNPQDCCTVANGGTVKGMSKRDQEIAGIIGKLCRLLKNRKNYDACANVSEDLGDCLECCKGKYPTPPSRPGLPDPPNNDYAACERQCYNKYV